MSEKLNKYKALRQVEYKKLQEIHEIATKVNSGDDDCLGLFGSMYLSIENVHKLFYEHHNSVIILISGDDAAFDAEDNTRKKFDLMYYQCKSYFFKLPPSTSSLGTQRPQNPQPQHQYHPKLDLDVPVFKGDIASFESFIDIFNALVHNNQGIPKILKFSTLKSHVEGPALTVIQHLTLTENNYDIAYDTLSKRFKNTRLLASNLWNNLENAPKVAGDNPTDLRNLLDLFSENVAALTNLGLPTEYWDFILVQMTLKRLPMSIITRFELNYDDSNTLPTYKTLTEFLNKNCMALDNLPSISKAYPTPAQAHSKKSVFSRTSNISRTTNAFMTQTQSRSDSTCSICSQNTHNIFKCQEFLNKNAHDRYQLAKSKKLCINCLSGSHKTSLCQSDSKCHKCNALHHTYLCFSTNSNQSSANPRTNSNPSQNNSTNAPPIHAGFTTVRRGVLLSTARIEVLDNRGTYQPLRCMLDTGSMSSFITSKCVSRLGLTPTTTSVQLTGLGTMQTSVNQQVTLSFRPFHRPDPVFTIDTLVVSKVSDNLPSYQLSTESWFHLSNIRLADDQFHTPGPVDVLLGADIFGKLLIDGRIPGGPDKPDAINTVLGYILLGKVKSVTNVPRIIPAMFCNIEDSVLLDNQLQRFWEIEELPHVTCRSPDDEKCEKIFLETHQRDETGRFIVKLPFKLENPTFPGIRSLALNRFYSLERSLLKHPQIYKQYREFIQEFLDLDHMELASDFVPNSFYLPHHCVIRPESLTTKLRVVYNGSAHLPNQASLNSQLYVGPKLQNDIFTILLNFRIPKYVLTADISKMFRQLVIHPDHQNYQKILWRFSTSEPIKEYRMKRLIYGLTCSPYLAIRTLLQLAEEEGASYPLAAEALRTSTYVDDIVTGSCSYESTLLLQQQLVDLLRKGGFELQKWSSNCPQLLNQLPSSRLAIDPVSFDSASTTDSSLKVLGLEWNASTDSFRFCVKFPNKPCTKRTMLSTLARIFDPLGMLSPVTFLIKHLIQQVWKLKLTWDSSPPPEIVKIWDKYLHDSSSLNSFNLPRLLIPDQTNRIELHCFGDASEKGFCSVLYFRCFQVSGNVSISFVCAKAKVAPLKTVSLPRLELNAAVLCARLVSVVCQSFEGKFKIHQIFCYSDSMVTLKWIDSPPYRWRTYIGNRVAFIQDKLPASSSWFYVQSKNNPADVGSRGMLPSDLLNCSLWWAAPVLMDVNFPNFEPIEFPETAEVLLEERPAIQVHTTLTIPNFLDSLIENKSCLDSSNRVLAYVLRFINNCRSKSLKKPKFSGALNSLELYNSLLYFVRRTQQLHLSNELVIIQEGKRIPKSLLKLSLFFDSQGILRVGGRLRHAPISFSSKFPALLPSRSTLTQLLIRSIHLKYLHAGVQTTHFLILQRFWIYNAKRTIRRVLSRCVKCWKVSPTSIPPIMGNLPLARISKQKPFYNVGVDYAGPFEITMARVRGAVKLKSYLCLFICLSIKAVHLELVSDLSANAFLAAFKRFISRRGTVMNVYSDCGTNFVKAYKILNKYASEAAAKESISWHFNPPSAPHFGGLWESNIKSVKSHLVRVLGEKLLTYEELYTVFTEIEAIVNSRPLTPVSDDPNDFSALTPGHFLTQESLTAPPEPNLELTPINRLSSWQYISKIQQHFWTRWSNEYLHTLHQKAKWHASSPNLKQGTLVVIKQDNIPPLKWPLGRILEVFPGSDGIVRVASVKTTDGIFKRPAIKLCPLPIDEC